MFSPCQHDCSAIQKVQCNVYTKDSRGTLAPAYKEDTFTNKEIVNLQSPIETLTRTLSGARNAAKRQGRVRVPLLIRFALTRERLTQNLYGIRAPVRVANCSVIPNKLSACTIVNRNQPIENHFLPTLTIPHNSYTPNTPPGRSTHSGRRIRDIACRQRGAVFDVLFEGALHTCFPGIEGIALEIEVFDEVDRMRAWACRGAIRRRSACIVPEFLSEGT
jgi:hypothetical protein